MLENKIKVSALQKIVSYKKTRSPLIKQLRNVKILLLVIILLMGAQSYVIGKIKTEQERRAPIVYSPHK